MNVSGSVKIIFIVCLLVRSPSRCGLISNSSPGRVRGDDAPAQRLQVPGGRGDCGGGAARQIDDRRSNCYLLSQRE